MPVTAVALLSGGLDSMLAIRTIQEQGVPVEALNVRTVFTCCQDRAAEAARELGVPLTVVAPEDAYLDVIRRPAHGYGRGANPCVDCRSFMFRLAHRFMSQIGADLVISGEVLGQRPMSQKRRHLAIVARESGLEDRLLRPLSAKLLPPTLPELAGQVDRRRLHDFAGRSRKGLIELARHFGFREIPSPSTGCALTEPAFAARVHDLIRLEPENSRWDFELLKVGRHVRLNRRTKVIVGRREAENQSLRRLFEAAEQRPAMLLEPEGFVGPAALVVGDASDESISFAGGLILRHSKRLPDGGTVVRVRHGSTVRRVEIKADPAAAAAVPL